MPATGPAFLPQHFEPSVAARLEMALARPDALWVTDADGTLWREDIGEAFLRHLAAERALVAPEVQDNDAWTLYEQMLAKDKTTAYRWAVQVMAGMREAELMARARAFAAEFVPVHLLTEMQALLDYAHQLGREPWIVSASCQWIIDAAAPLLGVSTERVRGVRVAVEDGRLTSEIVEPFTYRQGKVEAIRSFSASPPALVTGDSSGDVEMMAFASSAMLVIHPGKTDPTLRELAEQKGWLCHVVTAQ